MSDVRLSNGSPTLERSEPRLADHPKPSACRSLFGSVDHQELKRDLKGHLREMEEAASAKWGFDFANHTPLANGGFEWELVDCRDVPDFYSGQTRLEPRREPCREPRREQEPRREPKGLRPPGNNTVDLNGNHRCGGAPCEDGGTADGQMEPCTGPCAEPCTEQCTEQCTGLRKRAACHGTGFASQ